MERLTQNFIDNPEQWHIAPDFFWYDGSNQSLTFLPLGGTYEVEIDKVARTLLCAPSASSVLLQSSYVYVCGPAQSVGCLYYYPCTETLPENAIAMAETQSGIFEFTFAIGEQVNDDAFNSLCRKCAKTSCFDGRDFTPYFHIRSGEDRLQSTEILENAASFLFLPDELYHYRVNAESITHTIRYDGWRADFEVERLIHAWLEKLGVLLPVDFDRLRNHLLDELVVDLKRICRFCSGADTRRAALQSILDSDYYRDFLRVGYRGRGGGLRRILNRAALYLLRRGHFDALHFFCSKIYKAG